jgi:predicted DNA-binding protein
MTQAKRQAVRRTKLKKQGFVDVRLEVPEEIRDRLRRLSETNGTTMKREIQIAVEKHLNA